MKAIQGDAEYQQMFQKAYGREMNYEDLGRAIGAFERTLVFVDSPFRRFLDGRDEGHFRGRKPRAGSCSTARPAA